MAVLTVDVGGSPITLDCERGGHSAPRQVGPKTTGNSGAEESSVRSEAMVIPLVLAPLPTATLNTLRAKFGNPPGNQVPCAGDILNKPGTITFSGEITDELHETGDRWTANLTLYEIAGTGTTTIPAVYLANLPDDDTGAEKKAWATSESGFANFAGARLLDAETLTECGVLPDPSLNCAITYTDPDSEEISWLSTAFLADGLLYGRPVVAVNSKGGTGDKWQTQNCRAVIELVRSGVVVFSITTAYAEGNGGFSGGEITMQATGATAVNGEIGDRIRIRIQARAGLHGGYTDDNDGSNLDRQTITYGYTGAGDYYSKLRWGGLAGCLDPSP